MKAQEKAWDICLHYSNILRDYGNITKQVKKCAELSVDEMIDELTNCDCLKSVEYYQEVKKVISYL